ncbi:MAG: Ldh family oxidoreductase, partial [Pseudomonadota bacterium]
QRIGRDRLAALMRHQTLTLGGSSRRFSTNPVAIGVPTADPDVPFILDFATSVVAEGKCLVAHQGGKAIPTDALVDPDGVITDNTFVLYGETPEGTSPNPRHGTGALRAFGEHKGSGLALACELLAGALTGSGTNGTPGDEMHTGMLSIYIDPARFDTEDSFMADVQGFLDWIKASAPIDAEAGVLTPGDIERGNEAERRANGIPITADTWNSLQQAARAAGLSQAAIDEIAGPQSG